MTDFLSWITHIDTELLLLVNGVRSSFADVTMWHISSRLIWIPLYLLLTYFLVKKLGVKNGIISLVIIGLMIFVTDQVCASIIRPMVGRLRPSHPDNPVSQLIFLVNDYRGGSYGFPSCHAANTFALATFLSLIFKNRWIILGLIAWAILVSYSRLYLGVHYPGDLLIGGLIGTGMAYLFYRLLLFIINRVEYHKIQTI